MNDYRITVRVRNARLLRAIEAQGHKSVAAWCRAEGLQASEMSALIAMRIAPIAASGQFTPAARKVMDALCALPQELWTAEQLNACLPRNTFEREVSTDDIVQLVESLTAKQVIDALTDDSSALTDRQKRLVRRMHEDDEPTFEALREEFGGVSPGRVRQIYRGALRRMRQDKRTVATNTKGSLDD